MCPGVCNDWPTVIWPLQLPELINPIIQYWNHEFWEKNSCLNLCYYGKRSLVKNKEQFCETNSQNNKKLQFKENDNCAGKIISSYICMIWPPVVAKMVVTSVDGELSVGQMLHTSVQHFLKSPDTHFCSIEFSAVEGQLNSKFRYKYLLRWEFVICHEFPPFIITRTEHGPLLVWLQIHEIATPIHWGANLMMMRT